MTKDLTHYKELLQQAKTQTETALATVAKRFVPELYTELRSLGYDPDVTRQKIVRDCKSLWIYEVATIVGALQ